MNYILLYYSSTISGNDFSIRPEADDARNHKYRATDILISVGSQYPLWMQEYLSANGINFEVTDTQ